MLSLVKGDCEDQFSLNTKMKERWLEMYKNKGTNEHYSCRTQQGILFQRKYYLNCLNNVL